MVRSRGSSRPQDVQVVLPAARPARLANERTFLAWLRAASGLLLVGLATASAGAAVFDGWARWVADGCLVGAVIVLGVAGVRWWACERAMAGSKPLPRRAAYMRLAAGALVLVLLVGVSFLR
jgi:putative membrane protein